MYKPLDTDGSYVLWWNEIELDAGHQEILNKLFATLQDIVANKERNDLLKELEYCIMKYADPQDVVKGRLKKKILKED